MQTKRPPQSPENANTATNAALVESEAKAKCYENTLQEKHKKGPPKFNVTKTPQTLSRVKFLARAKVHA